ncbi:hypothetical protein N7526_011158 [Penicillium atrosanguineum]|nr:hypothetical protein N7526_011158 [Penicillium atrosanguineum]
MRAMDQDKQVDLLQGYLAATPSSSETEAAERSVPIKLQETDRVGQYLLTTEDAKLLKEVFRRNAYLESTLDRQNPKFTSSQFHGFFTLFWLGVALLLVKVAANNWRIYGTIWGKNEIIRPMFRKDAAGSGVDRFSPLLVDSVIHPTMATYLKLYSKRDLLMTRLKQLEKQIDHRSASTGHTSAVHTDLGSELTHLKRQDDAQRSADMEDLHGTGDTDHILSLAETIENGTTLEPSQMKSLKALLEREIELL